jgi:hypothetical protein
LIRLLQRSASEMAAVAGMDADGRCRAEAAAIDGQKESRDETLI